MVEAHDDDQQGGVEQQEERTDISATAVVEEKEMAAASASAVETVVEVRRQPLRMLSRMLQRLFRQRRLFQGPQCCREAYRETRQKTPPKKHVSADMF